MAEVVTAEALGALLHVVMIDLALAGDNAVVGRAGREGGKSRAQISRHRGVTAYRAVTRLIAAGTCARQGVAVLPLDLAGRPHRSDEKSYPGPAGEEAEFLAANLAMSDHLSRARRDGWSDIRAQTFPIP